MATKQRGKKRELLRYQPDSVEMQQGTDLLAKIRTLAANGHSNRDIAKITGLAEKDVKRAVNKMQSLELLSNDVSQYELHKAYESQLNKVEGWNLQTLSVALKVFAQDMAATNKATDKYNELLDEIIDLEQKRHASDVYIIQQELDKKIQYANSLLAIYKKKMKPVKALDIAALIKGAETLARLRHDQDKADPVGDTIVVAGLTVDQARKIIASDPVMQNTIEDAERAEYDSELMDGLEEFNK